MAKIGIDVSKAKLDCLWIRQLEPLKVKSKSLPNTPQGFKTLLEWAQKTTGESLEELHFVMEATGVYHETAASALHDAGAKISVINPAQVKDYGRGLGVRTKTDKQDSFVLARFALEHNPRLWEPDPKEIRELKALINRLSVVEKDIRREENRQEKAQFSHASPTVLESINNSLTYLNQEKARLEKLIDDHIDRHPRLKNDRKLLQSIPAVGPVVSRAMLTLLHGYRFSRASAAGAFVGLAPVAYSSGSSVQRKPRISKAGNSKIRACLYMAAVVAKTYNPDVKALYNRLLARGKSPMSALCAAMRKLVHICFGVLKH